MAGGNWIDGRTWVRSGFYVVFGILAILLTLIWRLDDSVEAHNQDREAHVTKEYLNLRFTVLEDGLRELKAEMRALREASEIKGRLSK